MFPIILIAPYFYHIFIYLYGLYTILCWNHPYYTNPTREIHEIWCQNIISLINAEAYPNIGTHISCFEEYHQRITVQYSSPVYVYYISHPLRRAISAPDKNWFDAGYHNNIYITVLLCYVVAYNGVVLPGKRAKSITTKCCAYYTLTKLHIVAYYTAKTIR